MSTLELDEPEPTFEILDYTSASPWERFITSVEEILRAWNIHENKSSPNTVMENSVVTLDDASYALTFHQPSLTEKYSAELLSTNDDGLPCHDEFLPLNLPTSKHSTPVHPLHRWTGLDRFLLLSPLFIADIFSSTPNQTSSNPDLHTAKLLLSSFAIAFHNTRCTVPIFVPTGHPWKNLFLGYRLILPPPQSDGTDSISPGPTGTACEVRFRTAHIPYVPIPYSHLAGLTDLFLERTGLQIIDGKGEKKKIDARRFSPDRDQSDLHVAAVFTYVLEHWYDEDWSSTSGNQRTLGSTENSLHSMDQIEEEDVLKVLGDDPVHLFDAEDSADRSLKQEDLTLCKGWTAPALPVGPSTDPLMSLHLSARFRFSAGQCYADSAVSGEMDAGKATSWTLECHFSDCTEYKIYLSDILAEAMDSWYDFCGAAQSADSGETKEKGTRKDSEQTGYRAVGTAIFDSARTRGMAKPTLVDQHDVEAVVRSLFDDDKKAPSRISHRERVPSSRKSNVSLMSAGALGYHLRQGNPVPYKSFLWELSEHLLGMLSPVSNFNFSSSLMGFMKAVWAETLKKIQWHWENCVPIPNVDMYLELDNTSANETSNDGAAESKRTIGIDLRHCLVHQKLVMLNCCIFRKRQSMPETEKQETTSRRRPSLPSTRTPRDNVHMRSFGRRTSDAVVRPLKSLYDSLTDYADNSGGGLVRLFDKITHEEEQGDQAHSGPKQSVLIPPKPMNKSSTEPPKEESEEDSDVFFDTVEDSSDNHGHGHVQPSIGKGNSTGPQSQSLSKSLISCAGSPPVNLDIAVDPSPKSLTESFIQLNYSSSMDSANDKAQDRTLGVPDMVTEEDEPVEVKNEEREGCLRRLENLRLVNTGEPLMVPETQEGWYMTEDMLRQQAELFEKMGTTAEAARIRAKMQSEHLRSDMEAFKAANPHAVLEDFVRWHSPRDWVCEQKDTGKDGQMSARMLEPGNLWQELWKTARRVPARRQRSLFKHDREAEKVMHYLDSLPVQDLFQQLLPTVFLVAYNTIVRHPTTRQIRPVAEAVNQLSQELTGFSWGEAGFPPFDQLISSVRDTELVIGKAVSLLKKIPKQHDLIERLIEQEQVLVKDGEERETVYDLFAAGAAPQQSFPHPSSREFVFTGGERFGVVEGRAVRQQRIYFSLREGEFRLMQTETKIV